MSGGFARFEGYEVQLADSINKLLTNTSPPYSEISTHFRS